MKKQFRALAAVFAAAAMVLLGATAAHAYPAPTFNLHLSKHTVIGGHSFDATVTANVTCTQWKVTFLGQSATATDVKTFTHTFTAPEVDQRETRYVHAQCTYDASAGAAGNAMRVVDKASPVLKQAVVLLPEEGVPTKNDQSNGLPGTGGPSLWIPIAAGLLILAGAYAALRNRRRDGEDDRPSVPAS